MMYSLIDIENRANSLNHRKGILDQLEDCIEHNFYANENDATTVLFVCVYLTSGSLVNLPIKITLFIFYHFTFLLYFRPSVS